MTSPKPAFRDPARRSRLALSAAILLGVTLSLSACKSSDEQAQEYYQSGLELLEQGDVDRAIVQFRNVFNADGTHYEARKTLADLFVDQGRTREAYSQYLRLAEQYPDDLPTRIALARIAFDTAQQQEFERHSIRAQEIAPEDPDVQAIDLARRYQVVVESEDNVARVELATEARRMVQTRPDDVLLLGMMLDQAARETDLDESGRLIDRLITLQPDNPMRYQQRLAWLIEKGDMDGVEAHLRATTEQFPDDAEAKANLLSFYISENRPTDAENYLRELAQAAPEGDLGARVDLIRYVEMARGEDAARAEIQTVLTEGGDPLVFHSLLAGFDFRAGQREQAIAQMQAVLEGVEEPSDLSRNARIQLARMLTGTGQEVEARNHVAAVLAEDGAHIGALKMQAAWDIQAGDSDAAVLSLRGVLDQAPEDVEAMSLMADAYSRAGERDLFRDFLSQAAVASGHAPVETLRLAQFLFDEERYLPAEDAILPALRANPDNVDLLTLLGRVYIAMPDQPRADGVIRRLDELDNDRARNAKRNLELTQISVNQGQEAAIAYLEGLSGEEGAGIETRLGLIRGHLMADNPSAAQRQARELAEAHPDNRQVQQTLAMTEAAAGDSDAARAILQDLIASDPTDQASHLLLVRMITLGGDAAAALAAVDQALEALPDSADLLWAKAGLLEQTGDVDGAIEIFETLYAQDSSSVIVANNLASLLATHRASDPDSVARATMAARRLRDTDVAPFMDTYGWLQHLNGNSADALPYLQGAAAGLPDDPTVQMHLGIVQEALGQTNDAKAQLIHALEMAGDLNSYAAIEARAALARLQDPAGATEPGAAEPGDAAESD